MASNTGQVEQRSPRYISSHASTEDRRIHLRVLAVFISVAVEQLWHHHLHSKSCLIAESQPSSVQGPHFRQDRASLLESTWKRVLGAHMVCTHVYSMSPVSRDLSAHQKGRLG